MKKTIFILLAMSLLFTGCEEDEVFKKGDVILNGYATVDLGLPSGLLWATCNIGATSPYDYGDYFAWGEVKNKFDYTLDNCDTYGKTMKDISGNEEYDVARSKWGSTWRMPTVYEFDELLEYCDWEITSQGCLVTGPNGNRIFLPAADYKNDNSSDNSGVGKKTTGGYWSSTPTTSSEAYILSFDTDGSSKRKYQSSRYFGRSVRAVSE